MLSGVRDSLWAHPSCLSQHAAAQSLRFRVSLGRVGQPTAALVSAGPVAGPLAVAPHQDTWYLKERKRSLTCTATEWHEWPWTGSRWNYSIMLSLQDEVILGRFSFSKLLLTSPPGQIGSAFSFCALHQGRAFWSVQIHYRRKHRKWWLEMIILLYFWRPV